MRRLILYELLLCSKLKKRSNNAARKGEPAMNNVTIGMDPGDKNIRYMYWILKGR